MFVSFVVAPYLEARVLPREEFPTIEINNQRFSVRSVLTFREEGGERSRRAEVRIFWVSEKGNQFLVLAEKEIDEDLEADVQMFAINDFRRVRDTLIVGVNGVGDVVFDPFDLRKIEQD